MSVAALGVVAAGVACAGCSHGGAGPSPEATASRAPGPVAAVSSASNQDPARYAARVVLHAGQAGINPQLLMAILYNESDKPHDPELERAWQRIKPDAAFGIANMHKPAFDDTKRGRDFADRDWQDLPDDPDLAIRAAAWYLHDLGALLPARRSGPYTSDELLALGYNAGPASMKSFAQGATPGPIAESYLQRLRANWTIAGKAVS